MELNLSGREVSYLYDENDSVNLRCPRISASRTGRWSGRRVSYLVQVKGLCAEWGPIVISLFGNVTHSRLMMINAEDATHRRTEDKKMPLF